ncbi:hypothetical protein J1N35_015624 [Gossypium stocksii]|uniref:Uncharacterized protein n=1 Tax=Gossypium stocksii TaxID=47602 RepID=A0A9D4A8R3_9ROSI|nr:hypothetical protein J1N35_015624 [Gossypium stocksii]
MEYVHEDTPQQEGVCARRNSTVMNKRTRRDVFKGKLPTKAVKEEKTPFEEQIFGTKDWDSQLCEPDFVDNEAKVEDELKMNCLSRVSLKQSILGLPSLKKKLMNDWYL